MRAACKGARCLLESNIALLPENLQHETDSGTNMLKLETYNRGLISSTAKQNYLDHSPNKAIDDRVETHFQSLGGEFIRILYAEFVRRHHDIKWFWAIVLQMQRWESSSNSTFSTICACYILSANWNRCGSWMSIQKGYYDPVGS